MKSRFESPIVLLGSRLLSPYIMLFGLYVIFHGHYSPGGGFQGGALLAASIYLIRISGGDTVSYLHLKETFTRPMAIIGVCIYFLTGLVAAWSGSYFLDYGALPIPGLEPDMLRYYGILMIEIGIGLAVMAILVLIYDNMVRGEDYSADVAGSPVSDSNPASGQSRGQGGSGPDRGDSPGDKTQSGDPTTSGGRHA